MSDPTAQSASGTDDLVAPEFTRAVDLAAARVGGRVLYATDEFFAEKENLITEGRGVFVPGKYTDRGKWMDGWESRRRRGPGHDWCIVRMGLPGMIVGVDVDTNHFTGNFPEHASLEACSAAPDATARQLSSARTAWTEIVPIARLAGGSRNFFAVAEGRTFSHVRLRIYPDGGVARLRVHGVVAPSWKTAAPGGMWDLAALENGGVVELANDNYFGRKDNLIMPGPSVNMGDGWETRRKRGPGHDWVIVKLGATGTLRRVEVDTAHFKGNFPDRCSLEAVRLPGPVPADFLASRSLAWEELLPSSKLQADRRHVFEAELAEHGPVSHVRFNIFPDGGVARLRLFGVREA